MKRLVRFALLALGIALAACAERSGDAPAARVEGAGLALALGLDPAEPRVGRNALVLELRDRAGAPVAGAELRVVVHMHAMGAMPAMGGPASVRELGAGRYRADYELDMGGSWIVEVDARAPQGAALRAEGSLTVGLGGLRMAARGGSPAPADASARAESEAARAAEDAEPRPGEFQLDPERLQKIGVRVGRVEARALERRLRAWGWVAAEEGTLADLSLKVRGWVRRLAVTAEGDRVERGQVLFHTYSPELFAAEEEYLQALRAAERARGSAAPERADALARAARNRLRLWDIAEVDLDALAARGAARGELPIRAPISGYLVEKNIVDGSAFEPGAKLLRIAPLERVWVEVAVYEDELPDVSVGQRARVSLAHAHGEAFEARVEWIYPSVDPMTRTGKLRLAVDNPDLQLRPGMLTDVELRKPLGVRLSVPQSALLYTGERSFVFRSLGGGRFRPQEVQIGLRSGEDVELRAGLAEGDEIVLSGTFLIASESRLRAAPEEW